MFKSILCFVLGIGLCLPPLFAQNLVVVDSLESALFGRTGKDRLGPLAELAKQYVDNDNERALELIVRAEREAMLSGDTSWIVVCLRIKGQILYRMERIEDANEIFETAMPIAARNELTRDQMRILMSYGINCAHKSQYDMALQKYFEAQDLAIKLENTFYQELLLNNIGIVYYKLKDYDKALHYLLAAYERGKVSGSLSYMWLINISLCYANQGDYVNAQRYLNESILLCNNAFSDLALIHLNYASALIHLGLEEYKEAERALLTSYKHAKAMGNSRMQLDNIYLLAEVYHNQNKIETALFYLKEGEKVIEKGVPYNLEIIKLHHRFSELYLATGNFKKAALYQSKYIALKDSIYNEELTTKLMATEAEYVDRMSKAKIASQREAILLREEVIDRQRLLNMVVGLLAIMIFMISVFIYRNYRRKHHLNLLLDRKVSERTYELERGRNELLRVLKERDLRINKIAHGLYETMNSLKGLCVTGREEVKEPVSVPYFDRIDSITNQMALHIKALVRKKEKMNGFGDAVNLR